MRKTILLSGLLAALMGASLVSSTKAQAAEALTPVATPVLPEKEPAPGTTIVHPADGAVMVWVPAGYFTMGMNAPEADKLAKSVGKKDYHAIAAEEWFPARKVWTEGYFVDKYEVTMDQWRKFAEEAKHVDKVAKVPAKTSAEGSTDAYPATSVLWAESQKYANHFGKTLPTEEQWEKAARGTDGRIYPWGNEPLSTDLGVFVDLKTGGTNKDLYSPVGSKPKGASPYGAMDMAGNVYEWTSDWMEPYPNNPERQRIIGYMGHTNGVLRGGSFYHGPHSYSCAKRFGFRPEETYYHVGFRTVWTPPPGYFESEQFKTDQAAVQAREAQLQAAREKPAKLPKSW